MHKYFAQLKGFRLREFNTESAESEEDLNDYNILRFPERCDLILCNENKILPFTYQRGDVDLVFQYGDKRLSLIIENFFED